MASYTDEASPQKYARIGGLLYLFIIVAAGFGELFVRGRLIQWGDAAATATTDAAAAAGAAATDAAASAADAAASAADAATDAAKK